MAMITEKRHGKSQLFLIKNQKHKTLMRSCVDISFKNKYGKPKSTWISKPITIISLANSFCLPEIP